MDKYYKILGIDRNATPDEIKAAYRKAASKHHPDKGGDAEQFKKISEAYEYLTTKPKNDFGSFTTFGTINVKITASEAFNGCVKQIKIGQSHIETIQVPAGILRGQMLQPFSHEGAMICALIDIDDPEFEVDPTRPGNIYSNIRVSPFMMMSGGFAHFNTVDGATMQVRIPSGVKPLTLLNVKGRGLWKNTMATSRGDCFLRVVPEIKKPHEYSQEEVDQFLKAREDFKKG